MRQFTLSLALCVFCWVVPMNGNAQNLVAAAKTSQVMEFIGDMAHPMQTVLDTECVGSGSDYIDVSIKFKSIGRQYWEDYRINLRSINGVKYYYSIVRTRKVSIYEPFNGLRMSRELLGGIGNYLGFNSGRQDDDVLRTLYGGTLDEISTSQLAAYNLMCYVIDLLN